MNKYFLFLCALFLSKSSLVAQAEITSQLSEAITQAQREKTTVKAIVMLKDQYNISALNDYLYKTKASLQQRAFTVITELQQHAARTQANLLNVLQSKSKIDIPTYQNFWICNVMAIEAKPDILLDLANRTDISQMDLDAGLQLIEPVETKAAPSSLPNSAEPGLKVINAHKLWQMGITGKGIIVMNLDTGVDGTHPALASRWRGNDPGVSSSAAWFDPIEGSSFPVDPGPYPGGHGTHTMGIIAGLDVLTHDTIGVAFDAKWIASRTSPIGVNWLLSSAILGDFQWAIDPDGHPDTSDDMPAVISNSWGHGWQCTPFLQPAMDALEAAGIALVFAAGNSGPASGTVGTPAKVNKAEMNVFSVGALNGNLPQLPIAEWSSRGPTYCTGLGNQIKPEVSAPGVEVRSSVPNGGYEYWSGTSMATPYVAGAIALLKQAFPSRTGTELKQMLYNNAIDLGTPGEDNDYGMGVIDVYAALMANISITNPMPPINASAYSDYQTPTSATIAWDDPVSSVGGDPLLNFEIELWRDNQFVTRINQGVKNYVDTQLSDGQQYEYELYTHNLTSDSLSEAVIISVYAGGSPFPSQPTNLSGQVEGDSVLLRWDDPITQTDGTPLDDLDKISIYRDGDSIASVPPCVESFVDYPLPGSTVFYTLQAVDNETPQHYSARTDSVECFVGSTPDYLVWVGHQAVMSTIASAESIFYAIAANGESVFLTNDLFEFGTDLSIFKAIFVVLGQWDHCHFLLQNDPEPQALEAYLFEGGKLYLEGGLCFNVDPSDLDEFRYNIRPWFNLRYTAAYTNSLSGIQGLDYFSNFSFAYSGLSNVFEELLPIDSTPIWENDSTGAICGVFNLTPGLGLAIGVIPSFGDLVDSSDVVTISKVNFSSFSEKFSIAGIRKPNQMENEKTVKFIKRFAYKPELKIKRRQPGQLLKSSRNGIQILANSKIDLMAAYLTLLRSNPPHAVSVNTNLVYAPPGSDTLRIASQIVNPDTHQISVKTIMESLDHSFVDSIPMYDDGTHGDSSEGNGIYGCVWPVPSIQKSFTIRINTFSHDLGINHYLNASVGFTTAGPLVYDSYVLSTPIPGVLYALSLTLRNYGSVSTITNVTAEIATGDTNISDISGNPRSFGNIAPGQTAHSSSVFTFHLSNPPPPNIDFIINISSEGYYFWSDSFTVAITAIKETGADIPIEYTLKQNFPNPFNPSTAIKFDLPKTGQVTLKIYNILGEEVATLVSDHLVAGSYQYEFDASGIASGVYFYHLQAGNFSDVRKMILMK
jgi:subtilisin family serine protease